MDELFNPVSSLLTLKPLTIKALARLKIHSISDLLLHKPHNYIEKKLSPDLSRLEHGQYIITTVTIKDIVSPKRRGAPIKIYAENNTGGITLIFFNKIPSFIFARMRLGSQITVEGKAELNDFYYQISHPEFIWNMNATGTNIEPIYPLTYGINNKQLHNYILKAMELLHHLCYNTGSKFIRDLVKALDDTHSPIALPDATTIQTLAELELLANQLTLAQIRKKQHLERGSSFRKASALQETILAKLGFTLSPGQQTVIAEIEEEQEASIRMTRMLQGDVGSGKTLVALMTILNVANANKQSALMAPTDLLATQHYNFFAKALSEHNIEIALLTSKTKAKDRKIILEKLASGEILILIGTHSLFQDKVQFLNLSYIIIDEQHKFGVEQRLDLLKKAHNPDLLVMTATPIPRSLTMTLFGDMTVSRLTSKPQNRPEITTIVKHTSKTNEVIESLNRKIENGERVYWICPLIEAAEEKTEFDSADAISRYMSLKEIFHDQVGLVHGKLSPEAKDEMMQQFKEGKISILVATTVIEVGIDVPEATLIIIENAERFGLAQLHQLRGRVGRGTLPSFCILLYAFASAVSKERLNIMRSSTDGFYISEQDLLLRGGGEILGTKQSGSQDFRFADLGADLNLLVKCNEQASNFIKSGILNPDLDFITKFFHQRINLSKEII